MIPKRSILVTAIMYPALSLSGPVPGVAQTLSVRSVVKLPVHEYVKAAVGGGVQWRTGKLLLDAQVAGGTEHSYPCGVLIPPGTDCPPVESALYFLSALVGRQLPFASSEKWRLDGAVLGGLSLLDTQSTTTHLTGAFGAEVSRKVAGNLRLGAVTRAWLLFPPFGSTREPVVLTLANPATEDCYSCPNPRADLIPVFDFGFMISF
jgi:hypothetical protein